MSLYGFVSSTFAVQSSSVRWGGGGPIVPTDHLIWQSSSAQAPAMELVSGVFETVADFAEVQFNLFMPDGRFDIEALEWGSMATGTIEWWVRPRPTLQLWRNAGWHYFMHLRPEQANGFQLDLWRHPRTDFRLTASRGMVPFNTVDYPPERIQIKTDSLDDESWQHLVVSWDLSADPQKIWLLVNGSGQVMELPAGTFAPGRFHSIEFGNRPSSLDLPFVPMDGAIRNICIYNAAVQVR